MLTFVGNVSLVVLLIATFNVISSAQQRVPFRNFDVHPVDREILLALSETSPGDDKTLVATSSPVKSIDCSVRSNMSFDGQCNHPSNHRLGLANTGFQGLFDPLKSHEIARENDLPSPRLVSNLVCHEDLSPENDRGMSELMTFFGQFVDHILAETHATKVSANIPIPADDSFLAPGGVISFNRSARVRMPGNRTAPQNIISSFLDGSAIYGVKPKTVSLLRIFKDGLMKTSAGNLMPINNNMHFEAGDVRANENPALQSMHTIWMREHNRVAAEVKKAYSDKNDDWLFDMTRRIVVAELQQVVFYEFVPTMLGRRLPEYEGYRSFVDGTVSNEFATVAYRVGHTLVNEQLTVFFENNRPVKKNLSDIFFQTSFVREHGIDGIFVGMLKTKCAEVDVGVTSQLRNFLFPDMTNGGADLVALNIQRGRDHVVMPYNKLREHYGLRRKKSFHDITSNAKIAKALHDVYLGDIDRVDAFVGGLAEDHHADSSLGELFFTAWLAEFTRMRDGNRFHHENEEYESFMPADMASKVDSFAKLKQEIKNGGGTMQRIIQLNTKIRDHIVPDNPFLAIS